MRTRMSWGGYTGPPGRRGPSLRPTVAGGSLAMGAYSLLFTIPGVMRAFVMLLFGGLGLIMLIPLILHRTRARLEKLIDHQLGAHFIALIQASDLPRDLSMTRLLRREAYERRIVAVREAAASLPPDFRREPPIHRLWSVRPRGG